MFERHHHRRIAHVLHALDASLLRDAGCLFGGGTAIALSKGEYRESVDIDLICSSVDGYRTVRGLVHGGGFAAVMKEKVEVVREPRVDQYGIRGAFLVDEKPIKFEIVFEGRVELATPMAGDKICGVWSLAMEDKVATKLMANSDRWADDSVLSRDIIDMAMLADGEALDPIGVSKALRAYGNSVLADFEKARERVLERQGWLEHCMKHMSMTMPIDDLRAKIAGLIAAPGSPGTAPTPAASAAPTSAAAFRKK